MREIVEVRVTDPYVIGRLGPLGQAIGYGVWKIVLDSKDPRLDELRQVLALREKETGFSAYSAALVRRKYSRSELAQAELLRLIVTAVFEPAGEEMGTLYDYSRTCHLCGAGRVQQTDLVLDTRRIPRSADIARTIGEEVIISDRLTQILLANDMTGFSPQPVHRRTLQGESAPNWHQLVITGQAGLSAEPTVFGTDPFDLDEQGRYRCPAGHIAGLNLLSELYIRRGTYDGSDIGATTDLIGYRSGLLVPFPLIVISQRLYQVLEQSGARGYRVEIAHLVDSG
jgi:hypothetical protein